MLQIMREMLLAPNLLVLDEPDVFLDFGNLGGLGSADQISYEGTMLVITHDRYLLDHCFNKILHFGKWRSCRNSTGRIRNIRRAPSCGRKLAA